jgi:DNA-binding response OmpR family regulator
MNTPRSQGSAGILIVEDELLVRMFAADALEEAGFEVTQAGDGAEALAALAAAQTGFAAVIIDLGLPDRSGEHLAEEIRAMHANLPIVIASGRSERELRDRFAGDDRIAILVKPYTPTLLLDSLESLGVTSAGG